MPESVYKAIPNFLNKEIFDKIILEVKNMPWFYSPHTGLPGDFSNYYFFHLLYEKGKMESPHYFNSILMPVIGRLNFNYLYRARLNLYTKQPKHIKTMFHVDTPLPHTVCLYSFSTNNGYTEFENGDKAKSIENNLITFPGNLKHRSINQTDTNIRFNLNLNLSASLLT